jgi:hypothetical protein
MADKQGNDAETRQALPAEEALAGLLEELGALSTYLAERGRHSYELAQRFLENARRPGTDSASRAYDERQATMLEYQHYIWVEIAGRVEKLLVDYGERSSAPDPFASQGEGEAE